MPGQFTPPTLQGSIKKQTVNYGFQIPRFDAPGWGLALEENWDTVDSVLYAFSGITNVKGDWQNSTLYNIAERVVDITSNTLWQVNVVHTSTAVGTFLDDRTAHPGYWSQVTGGSVPRGQWTTATNYNTGEIVTDAGRTGVINIRYTSGASYNADVTDGKITTIVDVSTFQDFTSAVNAAPNKPTLLDADLFGIINKAGVPATANHSWAQLKAGSKVYFDTVYQAINAVLSNTTATYTIAKDNKLAGIADGADVTSATSVGNTFNGLTPTPTAPDDTDEIAGNTGAALKTWTWLTLKTAIQTFLANLLVKPGTIVATGRDTADAGYLECDGAAVSRTGATLALFTAISTRYGAGNGTTTFNVPDFRGEFLRGWDHGRGIDVGRALGGAFQPEAFKTHTHVLTMDPVAAHVHTVTMNANARYGANSSASIEPDFGTGDINKGAGARAMTVGTAGGHTPTGTMGDGGGGVETRPRNMSVMYQIKL